MCIRDRHAYSAAEINEITAVLQRMIAVREVVYRVNQQYIASAAQADKYRTEPAFKLQGSYRNMNKLAEKISPVMNDAELQQLIGDHYQGESQLLTTGAEENLLKLGELRGTLTEAQRARWQQIKADFLRNKAMGAEEADVGGRVIAQLADIAGGLQSLRVEPETAATAPEPVAPPPWQDLLQALHALRVPQAAPAPAMPPAPSPEPREWTVTAPGLTDALREGLSPLLDTLASSGQQQQQVQLALARLADALRDYAQQQPTVIVHEDAGTTSRKRRPKPEKLKQLDEQLDMIDFHRKPAE